jgi:hypothetical protein
LLENEVRLLVQQYWEADFGEREAFEYGLFTATVSGRA